MKKISVEHIEEGMILSRDVCNSGGNILLSKGVNLSAALGRRLKNWGIPFIYIEGEESSEQHSDIETSSPQDLKNHLLSKFSNVMDNPLMKEIFVSVYQYRRQKTNR